MPPLALLLPFYFLFHLASSSSVLTQHGVRTPPPRDNSSSYIPTSDYYSPSPPSLRLGVSKWLPGGGADISPNGKDGNLEPCGGTWSAVPGATISLDGDLHTLKAVSWGNRKPPQRCGVSIDPPLRRRSANPGVNSKLEYYVVESFPGVSFGNTSAAACTAAPGAPSCGETSASLSAYSTPAGSFAVLESGTSSATFSSSSLSLRTGWDATPDDPYTLTSSSSPLHLTSERSTQLTCNATNITLSPLGASLSTPRLALLTSDLSLPLNATVSSPDLTLTSHNLTLTSNNLTLRSTNMTLLSDFDLEISSPSLSLSSPSLSLLSTPSVLLPPSLSLPSADPLAIASNASLSISSPSLSLSSPSLLLSSPNLTIPSSLSSPFLSHNSSMTLLTSPSKIPLTISPPATHPLLLSVPGPTGVLVQADASSAPVVRILDGDAKSQKPAVEIDSSLTASTPASVQLTSPPSSTSNLRFTSPLPPGAKAAPSAELSFSPETSIFTTSISSTPALSVSPSGLLISSTPSPALAPLHLRSPGFSSPLPDPSPATQLLVESPSPTIHLSGTSSAGHLGGVVLTSFPPRTGSPQSWVISHRGDAGFGAKGSLLIGTTPLGADVSGATGLDNIGKSDKFKAAVSIQPSGNVCFGCKTADHRVTVGGDVAAADLILVGSKAAIVRKADVGKNKGRETLSKIGAYKCEYGTAAAGALDGRSEWCLVPEEAEAAERSFVKVDGSGGRALKLRPVVTAVVSAINDLGEDVDGLLQRGEEASKGLEKVKRNLTEVGEFVNMLEDEMGVWKGYVKMNNASSEQKLGGLEVEIASLKKELGVARAEAEGERAMRELLGEQMKGNAEAMQGFVRQIEVMQKQIQTLDGEGGKGGGGGGGGGVVADEAYFLGLVEAKEKDWRVEQGGAAGAVTDKQLGTLRNKWRAEAFEALKRRREDLVFLEGRDK